MPNIDNIVKQLKNRKVFRSLAIYAAFAFVLIQVCSIVFPALLLPDWTMRLLVILVMIGFPTTLILSWIYDITPSTDQSEILTKKSRYILLLEQIRRLILDGVGILVIIALLIFIIVLLIFRMEIHRLIFQDSTPTQLEFQGKIIKAININEELVWTYELENNIRYNPHPITGEIHYSVKYLIENLDGNKEPSIIIAYKMEAEPHKSTYIICLSQYGDLLWKNKIGRRLNYKWNDQNLYYEDNYNVQNLHISDNNHDGLKEVYVVASQSPYFPDFLSIYDYQGNLLGEYLNHGTIAEVIHYDLDQDGIDEIIIGGQSNVRSFRCPYIAVLDFKRVSGQSPLYNCLEVPKGNEKYYILLPRVSFANKFTPRGNTNVIRILGNKIEVGVVDGNVDVALSSFFYFDLDFNFIKGVVGDNVNPVLEKLKREGHIQTTLEEEHELLQHPRYWNGDSLQASPTINRNWMKN